jgi:DNA-directed RNA polymerase specialized sigma24 family protein
METNASPPRASAETLGLDRAFLFWDADVIAAKKGDATAKQRLYERSLPIVRSVVACLVGYQDQEDLCQHVYLRLFLSLAEYSGR